MPDRLRVASFNVENLFSRAKVLNLDDHTVGDDVLKKIAELQQALGRPVYTAAVKSLIKSHFLALRSYIDIQENRGKLFRKSGHQIVGVAASGAGAWDGEITFRRAKFSEMSRENTARVIKDLRADVVCVVEAEDRPGLVSFNAQMLGGRFKYPILIDSYDPRGIDVGLLSRYPVYGLWTHIFDKHGTRRIFSRDCLEVEIELPNGKMLYVLCNHFKSRGYGAAAENDAKRKRQAEYVAQYLKAYDLSRDWVVVAGDLNDSPSRPPHTLGPLLNVNGLFDVLALQFPQAPARRWTYHYNSFEQIDYLLVSRALRNRFRRAGVERRGIAGLADLTNGAETEYDTVTHWSRAASDHAAVWAEFDL